MNKTAWGVYTPQFYMFSQKYEFCDAHHNWRESKGFVIFVILLQFFVCDKEVMKFWLFWNSVCR